MNLLTMMPKIGISGKSAAVWLTLASRVKLPSHHGLMNIDHSTIALLDKVTEEAYIYQKNMDSLFKTQIANQGFLQ